MSYLDDITKVASLDLPWEDLRGKNIKLTTKDDMELFKAYLAMDNKDDYLK